MKEGVHGALALEGKIECLVLVCQLANLLVLHSGSLQLAQKILLASVLLYPTNLLLCLLQGRLGFGRFGRQWGVAFFGVY